MKLQRNDGLCLFINLIFCPKRTKQAACRCYLKAQILELVYLGL
uniref:Uncharacterized protein n=1 Tax=Lepeophtheirus salmonis TaxID=72036 RepID=A0A0K2U832_LEPSM